MKDRKRESKGKAKRRYAAPKVTKRRLDEMVRAGGSVRDDFQGGLTQY